MNTDGDLQMTASDLLLQLDLRQDRLLDELDCLAKRLDSVLAVYVKGRAPKTFAAQEPERSQPGSDDLHSVESLDADSVRVPTLDPSHPTDS